jgi:hypothetical protein
MTETVRCQSARPSGKVPLGRRVASCVAVQRLFLCVEATSYVLLFQRILSTIPLCSIVWLASVAVAVAVAQAQEPPSKDPSLTATEPAFVRHSIENPQAPHLLLSMVDRSDRKPGALRNSAVQSTNPHPTDALNAGEVRLPSNPRGAEFASLAAIASASPSSLLYSIQAKGSGQADTSSLTNDNKAVVYQLGTINLVINRLPNSFSVSSAGNSLSGPR